MPTGMSRAIARRTRSCRGTTSRPDCTAISSGRTGRPRCTSTVSPIAGGRRATTAGCAPITRSSTSSRRRLPRRAGARGRDRTSAAVATRRSRSSGCRRRRVPVRGDTGFPVRIRFTKRGKVRFISHRDVARAFERAFRIEQLPLAFTQGFAPRPKVSFGLALSVGHESDAEYLDVQLVDEVPLDSLAQRISDALPDGIEVSGTAALADRAPALQEAITAVAYRVTVTGPDDEPVGRSEERRVGKECRSRWSP